MKVLCLYNNFGPKFVREGWGRVFKYCGHEFRFWSPEKEATFEVFDEFEPDLVIATTYDLDRALLKNIVKRPNLKVVLFGSAYGPIINDIDQKKYPIVTAKQQEIETISALFHLVGKPNLIFLHTANKYIDYQLSWWGNMGINIDGILNAADVFVYINGKKRDNLICDIGFVGGYWGYKSRNLDKYLLTLAGKQQYNIKIFGNQKWPIPEYLGYIDDDMVNDLFASAKICPNISEPHSTDLGFDCVERVFKVWSSGGFCISDRVAELQELIPDFPTYGDYKDFETAIDYWLTYPKQKEELRRHIQKIIFDKHTYFDRVAQILQNIDMNQESELVLKKKEEYFENLNCN